MKDNAVAAPKLTFAEFWPQYLAAHRDPRTRVTHYVGTTLGVLCLLVFLGTLDWHWLIAAPICGYGFAFASHYLFEGNNPKTFQHPLLSFAADFYMLGHWGSGRLGHDLARLPARA
jgi:hypothetical protein